MSDLTTPSQYLKQSEQIHSQQAVNLAIEAIATQLNLYYVSEPPIVLCVMAGAVYFTGQLLPKLHFPLELDYVQATRYHGNTVGGELKWLMMPKSSIRNRLVLILDDILDEGLTLKAIVDQCIAMGAKDVKVAVLADKLLNKTKPVKADYIGLTVTDCYVFGCGMDIHGWWRNLSAIHALNRI